MRKALVTGGAGFLGSHLCERLLEQNYDVTVIDDLSTGKYKIDSVNFIKHDIINPLPKLGSYDEIYNLACPASPIAYQLDPIKTWKTSVLGVMNVIDYLQNNCRKDARFFHASTSEIYGDPLEHPQQESYWGNVNSIGERSCYDVGKRAAESYIMDHVRYHELNACMARIFNTYGPRLSPDDGRVVSNFITQALSNQPITVYGNGTQTRSFCYVDDLIDGILNLTNSSLKIPVNIGNPEEYSMYDLALLIKENCDSKSPIIFKSLPSDDPTKRRPDISLIKEKLGWTPKVSFKEGLKVTIEWFKL